MASYSSSFPTLPKAEKNDTSSSEAPEVSNVASALPGPRESQSADLMAAAEADLQSSARSTGAYVSDSRTKAYEAMNSLDARFGNSIPFVAAGVKTPTFNEVIAEIKLNATDAISNAVSGAMNKAISGVTGKIGAVFGIKGMIPVSSNLTTTEDPVQTAATIKKQVQSNISADKLNDHLISLTSRLNDGRQVLFKVMPEVIENRSVSYESVAPPQFPGAFQKYKGTESTQWTINATFVSRTSAEATENLKNLNTLRGWTMPYFGENTREQYKTRLGAPPPTLLLRGFRRSIIGPMPVVITSLSWNWPKDVDYIPAAPTDSPDEEPNIPFPTVFQVAIQCVESLSAVEFNQFDLKDFFDGKMIDAFSKPIRARTAEANIPATEDSNDTPDAQVIDGRFRSAGRVDLVVDGRFRSAGRVDLGPVIKTGSSLISEAKNVGAVKIGSGGTAPYAPRPGETTEDLAAVQVKVQSLELSSKIVAAADKEIALAKKTMLNRSASSDEIQRAKATIERETEKKAAAQTAIEADIEKMKQLRSKIESDVGRLRLETLNKEVSLAEDRLRAIDDSITSLLAFTKSPSWGTQTPSQKNEVFARLESLRVSRRGALQTLSAAKSARDSSRAGG